MLICKRRVLSRQLPDSSNSRAVSPPPSFLRRQCDELHHHSEVLTAAADARRRFPWFPCLMAYGSATGAGPSFRYPSAAQLRIGRSGQRAGNRRFEFSPSPEKRSTAANSGDAEIVVRETGGPRLSISGSERDCLHIAHGSLVARASVPFTRQAVRRCLTRANVRGTAARMRSSARNDPRPGIVGGRFANRRGRRRCRSRGLQRM